MRYAPNILQFSPFDLFKYDDFACNFAWTRTLDFLSILQFLILTSNAHLSSILIEPI